MASQTPSDIFSSLPTEIFDEIILAAVKVRRFSRAARLRYVSRSWNTSVKRALYISRHSFKHYNNNIPSPWIAQIIVYTALGNPSKQTLRTRILRRAAEHIVAYRVVNGAADSEYALRDCLWEICKGPVRSPCEIPPLMAPRESVSYWVIEEGYSSPDPSNEIHDEDAFSKQTLLVAAIKTNETSLIRTVLPTFDNCPGLIASPTYYSPYG